MTARRRRALTLAASTYLAALVVLFGDVSLQVFNLLLVVAVAPLLWLLWAFCRWSAHQHANRYARDVEKVHGGRPVRVPERVR